MTNDRIDTKALYNIGYGLYVLTCNDGVKPNGMICNTVMQLTGNPVRIAVCVNKQNYSHDVIVNTKLMTINCLTVDTPFSVFERFGFSSGRDTDKFADFPYFDNGAGLPTLTQYINSYMALKVEDYMDMGTHGMFICSLSESFVMNKNESMTYSYYQANVKPKPTKKAKGYVCKICGYTYTGDTLPLDYTCPLCKHPASDFEKIG